MGTWRKSSKSDDGEGNCLEMAWDDRGLLARDSKNPNGEILKFAGTAAFTALIAAVKVGKLER